MKYKLYFDGNKTPQGTSCSYVVVFDDKKILEETKILSQETTVNEAEYYGVLYGIEKFLDYLKTSGVSSKDVELEIYGDSQLVIQQLKGEYECKKPNLRVLRSKVRDLLTNFSSYNFIWVNREQNLAR
jgi:ribonuclease HI